MSEYGPETTPVPEAVKRLCDSMPATIDRGDVEVIVRSYLERLVDIAEEGGDTIAHAGTMNMPFEIDPLAAAGNPTQMSLADAYPAGGLTLMATMFTADQLQTAGIPAAMPALLFRFARADGAGFYRPILLCVTDEQMRDLKRLVSNTVDGTLQAVRQQRKKERGGKGGA